MALGQILCPQVQALLQSTALTITSQPTGDLQLHGNVSTEMFRPLVPFNLRRQVFDSMHNIAHPGMRALRRLILSRYVWRGMAKEISTWARACIPCQRSKVLRHVHVRPSQIPVLARCFSHIHVDLVGPLPQAQGTGLSIFVHNY